MTAAGGAPGVAILATMDTKGVEADYLRQVVAELGGRPVVVDVGVVRTPTTPVDVDAARVAEAGGRSLEALRGAASRGDASEVMVAGATVVLRELVASGVVSAVVSLGGTQGTNNNSRVLRSLPYGVPKLLVSTVASGDVSAFVGVKDITMMFSVGDILGLNPFLRQILANAAGAAYGMAAARSLRPPGSDEPFVAMTSLGCLARGATRAIERFTERGVEVMTFHAVGAGGRAMEQMVRDGRVVGVFDYGLGDVADAVLGGLRAADDDRLTVAGRLGVPQVVVPGGIDHVGVALTVPNEVPARFRSAKVAFHNPMILVARPDREGTRAVVGEIGRRLRGSAGPTALLLPLRGVSSYSAAGGELHDEQADRDLRDAFRERVPDGVAVTEVDAGAEDDAFVDLAVDRLLEMIDERGSAPRPARPQHPNPSVSSGPAPSGRRR